MKKSAFTLVELSIVLMIIGLLAASVLVGRELINVAQIRHVVSQVEMFKAAAKTFKAQYNCLPGDCVASTILTGASDGNGDGIIPLAYANMEHLYFWQHLALAGLIPGNYSMTAVGTTWKPDINYPSSKIGGGYGVMNFSSFAGGNATGGTWLYPANYGYSLALGGAYGDLTSVVPLWPGITGNDALSIDTKIDDGAPAYGTVVSWMPSSYSGPCSTSNTASLAKYIANDNIICNILFINAF